MNELTPNPCTKVIANGKEVQWKDTKKLTGLALDWAVAKALGYDVEMSGYYCPTLNREVTTSLHTQTSECVDSTWSPSTLWRQGGEIIEEENITLVRCDDRYSEKEGEDGKILHIRVPEWAATTGQHQLDISFGSQGDNYGETYQIRMDRPTLGATQLEAAMRCLVMTKLGAQVQIPQTLL